MSANETQLSFDRYFGGTPSQPPLTGSELRDSGMESVLNNAPEVWKESFTKAILERQIGSKFTVEDIREQVGDPPYEVHVNAMGAMMFNLARKGLIRKTGETVKTERAERRHSDAPIWERVDFQGPA